MKRFAYEFAGLMIAFYPRGFWLRWRGTGAGLSIEWRPAMLFSERNGYRKALRLGPLQVELLKRYEL